MADCEYCKIEHEGICGEALVIVVRDARKRAEAAGLPEYEAWAVAELSGVVYCTERMVEDVVHPAAYDAALARAGEITDISDPDRRRAVLIAERMNYEQQRMRAGK